MMTSIYALSIADLEKRKLTTPPKGCLGDWYTRYSPDGKYIAFTRNLSEGVSDLFLAPVTGGEARQLTFDKTQVLGLAWAADGKSITFSSTRGGNLQLWKIALEGGEPQLLSLGDANGIKGNLRPFAASRRGARWILYTQFDEAESDIMMIENFR